MKKVLQKVAELGLLAFEKMVVKGLKKYGFEEIWLTQQNLKIHGIQRKISKQSTTLTDQPVIFIHGLGATAAGYGQLMAKLSPYFNNMLVISAPGHGLSPHHSIAYEQDLLFDFWTHFLMTQFEHHQKKLILIATSLGGAIALKYTTQYPHTVDQLILCSPAGAPLIDSEIEMIRQTFQMKNIADGHRFLSQLYHQPPKYSALIAPLIYHNLSDEKVQRFLSHLKTGDGIDAIDLHFIEAPILLIWGTSEKILPKRHLSYYRETFSHPCAKVKDLQIKEIQDFSHSPHLESTQALVDVILPFIKMHLSQTNS
jgi:pimeloyl-ACP methyl ester carboxylesterase